MRLSTALIVIALATAPVAAQEPAEPEPAAVEGPLEVGEGPWGFEEELPADAAPYAAGGLPLPLLDSAQACLLHVTVEGAILSRSNPAHVTLVTQNGAEALNFRQLDLDSSGGPHVNVQYEFDFDLRLEVDYLGLQGWKSVARLGPGDYRLQGGRGELGPLADDLRAEYASDFHSTEVNLQWGWCPGVYFLSGLRIAELREHYGVAAVTTFLDEPAPYTVTYDTINHLAGLQLGFLFRTDATGRRLSFEASARGALLGNRVNHSHALDDPELGSLHGRVDGSDAAFLGDLRCAAVFRWSPRFSLRAGYQFVGLTGVALSPEEVLETRLISNTSKALSNGNVWFQGVTAGFEYHW